MAVNDKLKSLVLTKAERDDILEWDQNHTMRGIARLFCEKYPDRAKEMNVVSGSQIDGFVLLKSVGR